MFGEIEEKTVNKLRWIAKEAESNKEKRFDNLAYLINPVTLREAFHKTRKDAAPGIDAVSAKEYGQNLEKNLAELQERLKVGKYRAPPVKRVWIPKADGSQRGLGLPCFEDKVLQRAALTVLESIYEQDFCDFSYGFRPGKSAHQALQRLRAQCKEQKTQWIIDVDIKQFFDSIDRAVVRECLAARINDRKIVKLVGKWLRAGVMEDGQLIYPRSGTPQGGVISPLLANICLHYILDKWFVEQVLPRLRGKAFMVRYADDFVIGCQSKEDAEKIMAVLPKRFEKYKLQINAEKTRLVSFGKPPAGAGKQETFDFLGFTHYWGRNREGYWVIKRKTSRKRIARTKKAINQWCRQNRHEPVRKQWRTLQAKLRGHYQYFALPCNYPALQRVYRYALRAWRKWLSRRSTRSNIRWDRMQALLGRFPLPKPSILHATA